MPNLFTKCLSPPAVQAPLAPEDEELLREDEVLTPIKQEGIRKKERPTDKGVSWLVKTQYISPLSTEAAKTVMPTGSSIEVLLDYFHYIIINKFAWLFQSLTEKQAKERRESRQGRNAFLDNLNDRYDFPFIRTPL
jgi:RNA polymerase II-associated factor 1